MVECIPTDWLWRTLTSDGYTVGLKHLTRQGEFVVAADYDTELHVAFEGEVTVFKNGSWLEHRRTAEASNLPTDFKRVLARWAGAMTLPEFVNVVTRNFGVEPTAAKEVRHSGVPNLNCFVSWPGLEFFVRHADDSGWHVSVEVQDSRDNKRLGKIVVEGHKTLPEALDRLRAVARDWQQSAATVLEVLRVDV